MKAELLIKVGDKELTREEATELYLSLKEALGIVDRPQIITIEKIVERPYWPSCPNYNYSLITRASDGTGLGVSLTDPNIVCS